MNIIAFSLFLSLFVFFVFSHAVDAVNGTPTTSLMTLIVMYFNNSLTIWDTEMNAIDKEKKSL